MPKLNITDYGAVADGATVCTEAVQRAIDLCEKGGTVYVPSGTFITGALYLKSDMTLFLEKGARLLGSGSLDDFPIMGYPFEGFDQLCYASLINTDGAPYHDITIDGNGGVIDANGAELFQKEMAEKKGKRGRICCIRNTKNLTIKNVVLRQSPSWGLHIIYCENVLLDNIEVHTKYDENGQRYPHIYNGDGIDIDSCKDVIIRNSLVASQDDSIAVKSGRDAWGRRVGIPSENITIENCTVKSGFGIAMGSEMAGGVKDVFVRNCTLENAYSLASVKAIRGRGNYIRNIHYENCSLVNRDTEFGDTQWFRGALYIDGFYGDADFDADTPVEVDETTPIIEDIYFKDITVDTISGNAVYFMGLPEMHYRNIHMENVRAHGKTGMVVKNIDGLYTENVVVTSDEDE